MHFKEALDYVKEKADNTQDRSVNITLQEIFTLMLISNLADGKRWAAKIETIVAYVEAGNYAFCRQDAKKILKRRSYPMLCS